MVLESTMICIDNSEWMRNGDYSPSRFQAQADAVNLICGAKTQSNPENTVGVMTMAGKGVRVLVTPTSDLGKILACMHGLEVGAEANLAAAIQVAQLALKHRQNKRQQQRIIVFIGSPVTYDKKVLETIGKKLKKNNVALDVVDFGETDDEKPEKLEALIAAVNSSDSSHIVHVPPGDHALSDVLISTPIFTGEEGGSGFAASAAAAAATGATGYDFGVDPNVDPELALALRLSMEEERARQEAIAKKAAEDNKDHASSSTDAIMAEAELTLNAPADVDADLLKDDDDAQLLQQALAMSMDEGASGAAAVADAAMAEAAADDQDLALALQMSVQDAEAAGQSDMSKVFEDRSFVTSILNSLPLGPSQQLPLPIPLSFSSVSNQPGPLLLPAAAAAGGAAHSRELLHFLIAAGPERRSRPTPLFCTPSHSPLAAGARCWRCRRWPRTAAQRRCV